MTGPEAVEEAIRLLKEAELASGNVQLSERLEALADSWINLAATLEEHSDLQT